MLNTLRGFEVDHSCFTPVSMVHTRSTKHSINNHFAVERCRLELGLNSFRYLGPKLWYSVPEFLKNLKIIVELVNYIGFQCFGWVICVTCRYFLNVFGWYLLSVYLNTCMVSFVCVYSDLWLAGFGLFMGKDIFMGVHHCLFAVFQFCCILFIICLLYVLVLRKQIERSQLLEEK